MLSIEEIQEIEEMVDSLGYRILDEVLDKELKNVRRECEKQDINQRDYLAGKASGIQEYKRQITLILKQGEEARQMKGE